MKIMCPVVTIIAQQITQIKPLSFKYMFMMYFATGTKLIVLLQKGWIERKVVSRKAQKWASHENMKSRNFIPITAI